MLKFKRSPLFIGGLTVVAAALACGPEFKILLPNRGYHLTEPPVTVFAYDAAHLLDGEEPNAKPKIPVEDYQPVVRRPDLDAKELSKEQVGLIHVMEEQSTGDQAYEKGVGLPEAVRLYVAGAVDFERAQMDDAVSRFKAVLNLPEEERKQRAVLAAFMLGRVGLKRVEGGDDREAGIKQADKYFELTRALVDQGLPDPLGLKAASYGEQAKAHLVKAGFKDNPEPLNPQQSAEVATASRLYAKQAALGAISGLWSLQEVSEWLFDDKARLEAMIGDPFMQSLLVAYACSRDAHTYSPGPNEASRHKLTLLLEAASKKGLKQLARSEGLAMLAYRSGQYDEAAAFAERSDQPLAYWVKAKLALQKGDLTKASEAYHLALTRYPGINDYRENDQTGEVAIADESGMLQVSRGDFLGAFKLLYRTSWIDAAYIAERILTTQELADFVDRYVPEPASPSEVTDTDKAYDIRWLLARRLIRDGEFSRAMAYFPEKTTAAWTQEPIPVCELAKRYIEALTHAQDAKTPPLERAQAWFAAAKLARSNGLEIMGYETFPDFALVGGNFDLGNELSPEAVKDKGVVSDEELKRFSATQPQINQRFHYRYIAVQEAEKAAELLPKRSQAYAAVLCSATGWMLNTNGETSAKLASELYRRYVKEGRGFEWAAHFGHDCPAPDFSELGR